MTTFATYDLPTATIDRAAAMRPSQRAADSWADDADILTLWLNDAAMYAAVLATADPADVRELVRLASVR